MIGGRIEPYARNQLHATGMDGYKNQALPSNAILVGLS